MQNGMCFPENNKEREYDFVKLLIYQFNGWLTTICIIGDVDVEENTEKFKYLIFFLFQHLTDFSLSLAAFNPETRFNYN